jgi:hypothetical protein
MEHARAAIVSEPAPDGQHVIFRRGGQSLHRGETAEEAIVVVEDRSYPRLLQHDLRDPDGIRIAGSAPGQIAGIPVEPVKKLAPKLSPFRFVNHEVIVKPLYTALVSEERRLKDELRLTKGAWGLPRAKEAAARVLTQKTLTKPLVQALLSDDAVLRHRASDTARRVTEKAPALLESYAEALIGLFSESAPHHAEDNWRTRAHLGLVCARIAHTRPQRLRVAGLLMPLYRDPSNMVRCTSIEGLGILARQEPSLRSQCEAIAEEALATGTLAMKDRARHALARLGSEVRTARRSGA